MRPRGGPVLFGDADYYGFGSAHGCGFGWLWVVGLVVRVDVDSVIRVVVLVSLRSTGQLCASRFVIE